MMSITKIQLQKRLKMAILCRDYDVNNVFISAMICRRGKFLNVKVKRVNFLLKQTCE